MCRLGAIRRRESTRSKWERFRGTKKQAEERVTELLGQKDKGQLAAPSKLTVGAYLDEWLKTTESSRAPKTHRLYAGIIKDHVKPALGNVLLQKLNVLHVERYYADEAANTGARTSKVVRHAVLVKALNDAVKKRLLRENVATLAANKPKKVNHAADSLKNVWNLRNRRFQPNARRRMPVAFFKKRVF